MTDTFPLPVSEQNQLTAENIRRWLAIDSAPGLGPVTLREIAAAIGDPLDLVENVTRFKLGISLNEKIRRALDHPDWEKIDATISWAQQNTVNIVPIVSSWYPPLLREISDPPIILYVKGDPELLQYPQIAMVGSRNPSHYGQEAAFDFARHLSSAGLIVTSGLAAGIDSSSHRGALAANGLTIAVFGTGLDTVYPAKNKSLAEEILKEGTLVSEYPPGTTPLAHNFPRRNRIISGMSVGTLVVEAAMQSGSLITARQAIEQGREVFAIPGSIHSPMAKGCHLLIRQGAKLVETGDDILQELSPMIAKVNASLTQNIKRPPQQNSDQRIDQGVMQKTKSVDLSPEQQQLLECIQFEPVSIDTLVARSRLTPEAISSMLVELEICGAIASSGGFYTRR